MKIKCLHGYFLFDEDRAGELSDFMRVYGFDIVLENRHYTFSFLKDAPRYSILGGTYLGAPAIKTFEGEPWDIMRQNKLVYDFTLDAVIPIASVTQLIKLKSAGNYYLTSGLIIPGSITDDGSRVKEYAASYIDTFTYSEVSLE